MSAEKKAPMWRELCPVLLLLLPLHHLAHSVQTHSYINPSPSQKHRNPPWLASLQEEYVGHVGQGLRQEAGSTVPSKMGFAPEAGGTKTASRVSTWTHAEKNTCFFSPTDKLIDQVAHGPVFNSSSYSEQRCWSREPSERERKRITGHPERASQARGQLPRVIVPQLHAAHADDLAHKTDLLPFQIFASQVLEIWISINYCEKRYSRQVQLQQTVER